MIIASDKDGMMLRFMPGEWDRILKGETVKRVTGWSAGYFRFEVKCVSIENPYEPQNADKVTKRGTKSLQ